jgi:hypothetical protein
MAGGKPIATNRLKNYETATKILGLLLLLFVSAYNTYTNKVILDYSIVSITFFYDIRVCRYLLYLIGIARLKVSLFV